MSAVAITSVLLFLYKFILLTSIVVIANSLFNISIQVDSFMDSFDGNPFRTVKKDEEEDLKN